MKKRARMGTWLLAAGLALLTGCSSSVPEAALPAPEVALPAPEVVTPTVSGVRMSASEPPKVVFSGSALEMQGSLGGLRARGAGSAVAFSEGKAAPFTLKVTRLTEVPVIPPVNVVNSRFLMGEVPGRQSLGAWRVLSDARDLSLRGQLTLDRPLGTQGLVDAQTEVFVRDNLTGEVDIAGTFPGQSGLVLDDFADLLARKGRTRSGQATDLTYFAYTAPMVAYAETCRLQGGKITGTQQYCSFADKKITPRLSSQAISKQSIGNFRTVSWNLGNVAQSCGLASGGANYNYKICYSSTERSVSDQILSMEQFQKPAVIFFQEIWHGDCRYTPESYYGTYTNQRLCASTVSSNTLNTLARILGVYRYFWRCSAPEDLPADLLVVNGYECVAIDSSVFNMNYAFPASAGSVYGEYHPPCDTASQDPNHDWEGRDTGYFYMNVTPVASPSSNIMLVSSHLVGVNNSSCRSVQINALQRFSPLVSQPFNLMGGDWNTNPLSSADPAAPTMRNAFGGSWGEPAGAIGTLLDDPNEPTAFYTTGNQNLDHVMGRGFGGYCVRGPNFNGTDHTFTSCQTSAPGY